MVLVLRFFEHTPVELQPGQLPIIIPCRTLTARPALERFVLSLFVLDLVEAIFGFSCAIRSKRPG